jgi:hypothetical protein
MATTYGSVTDLTEARTRAAEAHGKHEQRTGKAARDGPDWYALTWCARALSRRCRHEQRL